MRRAKEEPEGVFPILGSLLEGIMSGSTEQTFRDGVDGLTISTVETSDMGWETAIIDANSAHPVERYGSEEQAEEGHKRWCKQIVGENSIREIGYGDLLKDTSITLIREENDS